MLNIDSTVINKYNLDISQIKAAKAGDSITLADGTTIQNEQLVLAQKKQRSYAYCSDTIYDPGLIPYIFKADLLYHEATYLHELQEKAAERMHATSKEAGLIAKPAEVGQLIIGHYSSRYDDLQPLEDEAKSIFANTNIVRQGDIFSIDN